MRGVLHLVTASSRLRLFFALPLPEAIRCELSRFQSQLKLEAQGFGPIRWTGLHQAHLTLAFLGEHDADELPRLCALGEQMASLQPRFSISLGSLGAFPNPKRARIYYLCLKEAPGLGHLAALLRQGLADASVAFDPKPFVPHLTLARLKSPQPLPILSEKSQRLLDQLGCQALEISAFSLYQSVLGEKGVRHIEEARFELLQC